MKRHLLTAALAIVAIGGAFALQTKNETKTLAPPYYINPEDCTKVDCAGPNTAPSCSTVTLFLDPSCEGETELSSGFIRQIP